MKRVSRYVGLYTSDMSQNQGFHSPRYRGIPALAEARKKFGHTGACGGAVSSGRRGARAGGGGAKRALPAHTNGANRRRTRGPPCAHAGRGG
eukprot:2169055-Pyramimonas_sp.AAC.1